MEDLKKGLKNQTRGRKYVTSWVKEQMLNTKLHNELIEELLTHHPTKKIQKENISYIMVKIRPPFNQRALYFKLKEQPLDDISYIQCIKNLFGKFSSNEDRRIGVTLAFRNHIHNDKKEEFFMKNTYFNNKKRVAKCDHCEKVTEKIHIDHYKIPFKVILKEFLSESRININQLRYKEENNILLLVNNALAKRWVKYHDSKVSYRVLCASCNSRFSSYGF